MFHVKHVPRETTNRGDVVGLLHPLPPYPLPTYPPSQPPPMFPADGGTRFVM